MPIYACNACRVRFFAHDTLGRRCPKCNKGMYMPKPEAMVSHYRIAADSKKPLFVFKDKYDGQLTLALIDGATVTYKGEAITNDTQRTFLNDKEVEEDVRREYTKQQGERDAAQDLHDDSDVKKKQLCIVEDYIPNSEAQKTKIGEALAKIPRIGGRIRLYIIAHHDPDSKRMAGLDATALAALIGSSVHATGIKSITLVGCHTAGEAKSSEDAANVADLDSFASLFHARLGELHRIYTIVNGYTAFVQLRGKSKRSRFDDKVAAKSKLAGSKIRFFWNESKQQARELVYKSD